MKRFTRTASLTTIAAAALALAACSASPEPPAAPAPAPPTTARATPAAPAPSASPEADDGNMATVGPGTAATGYYEYMAADYASTGAFELPGTCPADLLAALASMGASDAACLTVDVDNTQGMDLVNPYAVNLYRDGEQFQFIDAYAALSDLRDATGADVDVDLMNKYQQSVEPGERADVNLVYADTTPLPSTVDRVTVQPNGALDTVDAYKG